MRGPIRIFTLVFLLTLGGVCSAQLVKTLDDVQKLKANEQLFINKPLNTLLKEIKPSINMVTANPSNSNKVRLGYLIFRFVDKNKFDSLNAKKVYPLQITVFVKEPFEWDEQSRQKNKKSKWTNEDVQKYGNLTVVAVRTYGKN